jgi:undecaprenyl-diphosphatase
MNFVDIFKAILMGFVEGLTEFLPVSSTAHLLLTSQLIKFNNLENGVFEVVIQIGAILAVILLYHKKIFSVILNIKKKENFEFATKILISFIPAAIIGLVFHDVIKKIFFSNIYISLSLIVGGIVMIFVEKIYLKNLAKKSVILTQNIDDISFKKSLLIGFCQVFAMIPGVSRSASTIIGGMIMSLDRKTAAEFSFFLALPTISAASIYDFYKNYQLIDFSNLNLILIATLASFVSAIIVIKWFINFISKNSFMIFAIYRILAGILIFFFLV